MGNQTMNITDTCVFFTLNKNNKSQDINEVIINSNGIKSINQKYHTARTAVLKSNGQIVDTVKSIFLKRIYMTTHFPSLKCRAQTILVLRKISYFVRTIWTIYLGKRRFQI